MSGHKNLDSAAKLCKICNEFTIYVHKQCNISALFYHYNQAVAMTVLKNVQQF